MKKTKYKKLVEKIGSKLNTRNLKEGDNVTFEIDGFKFHVEIFMGPYKVLDEKITFEDLEQTWTYQPNLCKYLLKDKIKEKYGIK